MDAAGRAVPSLGRTEPLSGELGKLRRRRRWILTPSAAVRNLRWPMVKWSRPTGRKSLSLPPRLRSRCGNSDPHVLSTTSRSDASCVAVGSFTRWTQKSCRDRVAAPDKGRQTCFRAAAGLIAMPSMHLRCAVCGIATPLASSDKPESSAAVLGVQSDCPNSGHENPHPAGIAGRAA
jgi:hypothetical protein